jgi:nitroreductase
MDILTVIRERQSVRAFLEKPVLPETIIRILDIARFSASGSNTQPWHVTVVGPIARQAIQSQIIEAREAGVPENPDYNYYPTQWEEPYLSRRKACGMALYSAVNIAVSDKLKRKAAWYQNYGFFGAPVGLILHLNKTLSTGSWLDTGIFLQSLMLAARGLGLETCPQASLAEYPDIIRRILGLANTHAIICGLALGYADWSKPVNQYRTEREPVEAFSTWVP